MALDFTPQFHIKNSAGQWQYRVVAAPVLGLVIAEALRLREAGEPMAPFVNCDPAPSGLFDRFKD